MKKVVCVNTNVGGLIQNEKGPTVEKGKIYTVIGYEKLSWGEDAYVLLETGSDWVFNVNMFIDLIEDQQDETCFVRDYNKETV